MWCSVLFWIPLTFTVWTKSSFFNFKKEGIKRYCILKENIKHYKLFVCRINVQIKQTITNTFIKKANYGFMLSCSCCQPIVSLSLNLAVRFGRIPKREKQRLLDEMQSYMNSLNESSTMGMETSPPHEPPPSPSENQSKEAIGTLSRAYQDIFTNTQDRLSKRAGNMNTSSRSSTFQNNHSQDSNYPHMNPLVGYHSATHESFSGPTSLPVASRDSKCPVSLVDSNRTATLLRSAKITPSRALAHPHNILRSITTATWLASPKPRPPVRLSWLLAPKCW